MSTATPPLVPAAADLRSYDWFPFFHKRLRQSSFWKRASDLACRISVDLWSEAYEQVPAASLPDDDHLLAEWAGFGRRDLTGWLAVKAEVMSAWKLCSDGRWYHPTLSEVACEAFVKQRHHLWARECDRLRKENGRRAKDGLQALEMPPKPSDDPFEDVQIGGAEPSADMLSERVPADIQETSGGCPADTMSNPAENPLRRTRTERFISSSLCSEDSCASVPSDKPTGQPKPKPPRKHPYPPNAFDVWYAGYPHKIGQAAARKAFARVEATDAVAFGALVDGVTRYRRSKPSEQAWCNPATWLNQARWADEPATSLVASLSAGSDGASRIDFGGGVVWPETTVRRQLDYWRRDASTWPADRLGPPPGAPGCKLPERLLQEVI